VVTRAQRPSPMRRAFLKSSSALAATTLLPIQATPADGDSLTTKSHHAVEPAGSAGLSLMQPDLSRALDVRCLTKSVLATRLIDDMERDAGWSASPAVTLEYTTERAKVGARSLRFRTLLRNEEYIKATRTANGSFTGSGVNFDGTPFSASVKLTFDSPQDWSDYNRLSLWCYLHATDNPINCVSLQFLCQGASAGPADPVAVHYIGDLKRGEWNRLSWEISEYRRDRIVEFTLFQPLSGVPYRGIDATVTYDLDQLQLERVEVEPVQGWAVSPRKIAYSHIGYQPGATKLAICCDSPTDAFALIDALTGRAVAQFSVRKLTNRRGRFHLLDFTAYSTPGTYRLQCGEAVGEAFEIGEGVWHQLIDSTLNGFYGFRCGCAVPGVHEACHLDVFVDYQGERRVVGGGWHDAANLTQGPGRTHLSIYALLRLYEPLAAMPLEAQRATRVLDEARWGLDWSLRMRFGPGLRCLYGGYSYWTDSETGTDDDVVQENVGRDTFQNILATLATAAAARVLKSIDPVLSARALKAAQEDYAAVTSEIRQPSMDSSPIAINGGSWRDHVGYLTLAAVELHRATGQMRYRVDALKFGRWLLDLQEQQFVGGSPITGYFYEDAPRTRLVHEFHNGFEECGLLALQALCDRFPDDPQWISWYAGLVIYSEYFCQLGTAASAPFDIIPAAVWRRQDLSAPPAEDRLGRLLAAKSSPLFPTAPDEQLVREQMLAMYEAGTRLSDDARLRVFPLWHNHIQHGATVVHLGKTAGLACAAQVRGRCDLAELAARQLQWVLGTNPFSRSLIYGVGYDFWQNFTVAMPNLVGGMSLGFNSYSGDAPAWGNNAVFPYKEMWIFSSCRIALNLAHIGMPARIHGFASVATTLREQRTGQIVRIAAGRYSQAVPAGRYSVLCGGFEWQQELVDGRHYRLALEPEHAIAMTVSAVTDATGAVRLELRLRGRGRHEVQLRLFNCETANLMQQIRLNAGTESKLTWQLRVTDTLKPWVVVAIPDAQVNLRQEAYGHVGSLQELS